MHPVGRPPIEQHLEQAGDPHQHARRDVPQLLAMPHVKAENLSFLEIPTGAMNGGVPAHGKRHSHTLRSDGESGTSPSAPRAIADEATDCPLRALLIASHHAHMLA